MGREILELLGCHQLHSIPKLLSQIEFFHLPCTDSLGIPFRQRGSDVEDKPEIKYEKEMSNIN